MKKILILTILLIPIWSMAQEPIGFDDTTTANGKPTRTVSQLYKLPTLPSRIDPIVTKDSIWTGGTTTRDTTLTVVLNSDAHYVVVGVMDTGTAIHDTLGMTWSFGTGWIMDLTALDSAGNYVSVLSAANDFPKFLLNLPVTGGGTLILWRKNVVYSINVRTKIIVIEQ